MIYPKYVWRILVHKWFVLLAGLGTVPFWRLLIHDWTKFGKAEFGPYARRYVAGRAGKLDHSQDEGEWQIAWMHHWHHHPHHWEHWLKIDNGKLVPVQMPMTYILEMIADWRGAGRAYNGTTDISQWYITNSKRLLLHPETRVIIEDLLFETLEADLEAA